MKHSSHTVAVHIVTHNSDKTIESCLIALQKQSYRDMVTCVIDNNSTDKTTQIVRTFDPQVLVVNKINLGYAAGHNQALTHTKSKYVLTLNPDVLLRRDFIEQMVKALERAPSHTGSAAGLLYRVNNLNDESELVDGAGLYLQKNRRQHLRYEGAQSTDLKLTQASIFGPDGAAAFYRRKMLEDIDIGDGVFDEDFFMHKEDVDVCWRAQLLGWTSVFIPSARGYHIRTFRAGKRQNIDSDMKRIAVRNRYYLLVKNEQIALFLRDLIFIVIYDLGIFFYLLLNERSSLVAYAQVIQKLPLFLKKRSRVQSSKTVRASDMARWFQWGWL